MISSAFKKLNVLYRLKCRNSEINTYDMIKKVNFILLMVVMSGIPMLIEGQNLSAPQAQGVFGGQVMDIESWDLPGDSVGVIFSTESPNSIFIGKGLRGTDRINFPLTPLPSADTDDGYGSSVFNIEVHPTSGSFFFLSNGNVYRTNENAATATLIQTLVKTFIIQGDTICFVKNNTLMGGNDLLEYGPLDAFGIYTLANTIDLLQQFNAPPQMVINSSTGKLHLFVRGSLPQMLILSDSFNNMNVSTILTSAINPAPVVPNIEWQTLGFAEDGTWYIAGQPPLNNPNITDRTLAWSQNNGMTWQTALMNGPGPQGGVVGQNILIEDISSERHFFCGNLLLTDTTNMSTWYNPGIQYIDQLNRANDGKTVADPAVQDIKYHSTNIGFGYSVAAGDSLFGWNEGLEAVQVNDIDMTADFSTGWVASKSGIRKVENYNTPSPTWAPTIFPNFDGAPYESVAINPNNNQIVFVGNQRIYRTTNGGVASGPDDGWEQVFTPELPPYNYNMINAKCVALAISSTNSDVIMAGYHWSYGERGGVFYSLDGGNTWGQLLLNASTVGQDVDVNDIELVQEGGLIVAYIGVESDITTSGAYGLFRAELNGTLWNVAHDGSYGATDGIIDLETNLLQDTLILLNRDPGLLPVNNIQIKDLVNNTWISLPGPNEDGTATAITLGDQYVYLAMDERIYMSPFNSVFSWTLGYAYPVGTEINVLFYDELLVGTGTGLYAHQLDTNSTAISEHTPIFKLSIYPNPNHGLFQFSSDETISAISLFDTQGKLLESQSISNGQTTVDFQKWPKGLYLMKFITPSGKQLSQTMLIE